MYVLGDDASISKESFMRVKDLCVLIQISEVGALRLSACLSPPVNFIQSEKMQYFFRGPFLLFVFHVCLCHTVSSVPCNLVVTCRERTDLISVLCVMISCVFVTFQYGVLVSCAV